jgi:high-affinity nickel permease
VPLRRSPTSEVNAVWTHYGYEHVSVRVVHDVPLGILTERVANLIWSASSASSWGRAGTHDAEELEELLASRGFANRFFGRLFGSIRSTKTIADKITVPAILASILHPLSAYASVIHPTLFAAERLLR